MKRLGLAALALACVLGLAGQTYAWDYGRGRDASFGRGPSYGRVDYYGPHGPWTHAGYGWGGSRSSYEQGYRDGFRDGFDTGARHGYRWGVRDSYRGGWHNWGGIRIRSGW